MEIKDYYEILGCSPEASAEEIKKAYRELASKLHPDLASPRLKEWAERQMKLLNEAYGVLGDQRKRMQYDEARLGHRFRSRPSAAYSQPAPNPSPLNNPIVRTFLVPIGFMVGFSVLMYFLRFLMWNPKGAIEALIILGILGGMWWMRRGNRDKS